MGPSFENVPIISFLAKKETLIIMLEKAESERDELVDILRKIKSMHLDSSIDEVERDIETYDILVNSKSIK